MGARVRLKGEHSMSAPHDWKPSSPDTPGQQWKRQIEQRGVPRDPREPTPRLEDSPQVRGLLNVTKLDQIRRRAQAAPHDGGDFNDAA
jgi:hypothetical protein